MRAQDIVNQLAIFLPTFVDDFTTQIDIIMLTSAGSVATAITSAPHGLSVGAKVNMTGAQTPISILSIDRVGTVGTLVTSTDHDITENAGFDVEVNNANEPEFNGTFSLISVPNRQTLTFQMDDSGATSATGSPLLLNGSNPFQSYNGVVEVTSVPTADSFEYNLQSSPIFSPAAGNIIAKTAPRISAAVSFERLIDSYTRQAVDDAWLFVVLGDAISDKSRRVNNDSVAYITAGNDFDQRIIQAVDLFLFLPSSNQIAGRPARDRAQELLQPICRSILRVSFPTQLSCPGNPLIITGHGLQAYDKAFYVHQYSFESTIQLTNDDAFIPDDDVAFRDIDLTIGLDIGTETFDTYIDLDDEPLV